MEITANANQTVGVNQNILFTETPISGNCAISHREGSGLIKLKGITNQCRARFRVTFGGNIAVSAKGTLGPILVAIALDGEAVGPTTATVTPAAIGNYFNVFCTIYVDVPRNCCSTISVKNISSTLIDVQNANLIVTREA